MRRRSPAPSRASWLVAAVAVGAVALPACGDDGAPDAERFCGEVRANREAIVDPQIADAADIDALLDLYRDIARLAPLDIEPQWQALVENLETASSVDPEDPESLNLAYAQAYATERSAQEVREWLRDHCRVRLPPVATYAPPPSTSPTTTPAG